MKKKYNVGIDIGGTKIAYGLFDENKKLLDVKKEATDISLRAEVFFEKVIESLQDFLEKNGIQLNDVSGIGIGIPSFVNYREGYIIKTISIPNLSEFPLRQFLRSKLGKRIRIEIDNDGHTGALAVYRDNFQSEFKDIIFCPVSTGISSTIIINGEVFRGSYGWAGESGHMLANMPSKDSKSVCNCGNPECFNSYCSGRMIAKHVQEWIQEGEASIMPELAGGIEKITAKVINDAYELGDQLAILAVEQMAQYMAMWLFNCYQFLNINCFVFSGGLLKMGDKLLGRVEKIFRAYNKNDFPVYFFEADAGEDNGIIGAMELLY